MCRGRSFWIGFAGCGIRAKVHLSDSFRTVDVPSLVRTAWWCNTTVGLLHPAVSLSPVSKSADEIGSSWRQCYGSKGVDSDHLVTCCGRRHGGPSDSSFPARTKFRRSSQLLVNSNKIVRRCIRLGLGFVGLSILPNPKPCLRPTCTAALRSCSPMQGSDWHSLVVAVQVLRSACICSVCTRSDVVSRISSSRSRQQPMQEFMCFSSIDPRR